MCGRQKTNTAPNLRVFWVEENKLIERIQKNGHNFRKEMRIEDFKNKSNYLIRIHREEYSKMLRKNGQTLVPSIAGLFPTSFLALSPSSATELGS
jgi:hypothetical protein